MKKTASAWLPVNGKWGITAEPEHPGNRVLHESQVFRDNACFSTRQSYTNFEFSVRMRTDAGQSAPRNWQTGILFRWAGPDDYYKLRITAANIALSRVSPAVESAAGTTPAAEAAKPREEMLMILPQSITHNQWHLLGVHCHGERITVALDGRELRVLTDAGIGSGKIGLFSHRTRAYFDDLQLTYLKTPEFKEGLRLENSAFQPVKDLELLVYYQNPRAGKLELRVLDEQGRLFSMLTNESHHAGINSIAWDGQGLAGQRPQPGLYTLELNVTGKRSTAQVRLKL
jgi:hypothetical protein